MLSARRYFIVHAIHATRRSKSQPFSLVKQVVDALEPASLVLKVAAFAQLREFAPTPWDLHPNLFLIRSATILPHVLAVVFLEKLATESVQRVTADLVSVALFVGAVNHVLVS